MKNAYTLRKLKSQKKAQAQKILDGCVKGDEVRDMSDDEKALFDTLMADVQAIKDHLAKGAELDDEDRDDDQEDMDDSEKTEEEPRSRKRASRPWEGQAPAIHTKRHKYSVLRALRCLDGKKPVDGLEGEISRELEKRTGKSAEGFLMPLGNEEEFRDVLYERRDLTTSSGTGAVFVVPELPFIELLRNKLILTKLGVTYLTGMEGKFSIPRQSAAATGYWVSEESSVTASNQTLDQVAFVDKTLGAATNISRKFIYQTSVDAEAFVKNDLAAQLAIALEAAAINGSGSGAVPTGILQNSTIQTNSSALALGTNGGAPTFGTLVNMETQVASYNADRGKMAYLTAPSVRGTLKQTPKISASPSYPIFLWEDNGVTEDGVPYGSVNGYEAYATNNVPSNLTKGTGTGLGGIIFGNWNDLVIAQWGGIDVIVNPYSNQLAGTITISMLMEVDVEVRHPESFAIVSDCIVDTY